MSTTIITTDEYTIKQDASDESRYTIFFRFNSEALIKSIIKTKSIKGATSTNDYKTLTFKAQSVSQFCNLTKTAKDQLVRYNNMLRLLTNLVSQLEYLITSFSLTFLGYNPENLIIINDTNCIYLSNEALKEIDEYEEIMITSPFSQNDFYTSPELNEIKEIPAKVHYRTSYYSLGCLIVYILTESNVNATEELTHIQSIKGTKLDKLIKRCLVKEPKKRSILFI